MAYLGWIYFFLFRIRRLQEWYGIREVNKYDIQNLMFCFIFMKLEYSFFALFKSGLQTLFKAR